MYLEGQGDQRGYAMAAVLVSVAVLAVLMSVALPAWRHQSQREKEIEFIFRGEQWMRALAMYQRVHGPGNYPGSLDVLVQQRFARKNWKDPLTGKDFVPVRLGQQPQQQPGGRAGGRAGGPQPPSSTSQLAGGAIIGVRSESTATSIVEYKGATRHDQFQFLSPNIGAGGPGGPGGGFGGPGGRGRGAPGIGPGGQRGVPPGGQRGVGPDGRGGRGPRGGFTPPQGGGRRGGG